MLKRIFNKAFSTRRTEKEFSQFFQNAPQTTDGSAGAILQYVGISAMYLTPVEILMYHLFRERNFDVDYLVYDESIPINEVITREREEKLGKEKFWKRSCQAGSRNLRAANVAFETIPVAGKAQNIIDDLPNLEAILQYKHDDIDFGHIVSGGMYRYYKSLTFGDNAEAVARRMMITALSNYFCIQSKCQQKDYRFVAFSHGIYVTWQPVVEYCKRNGIDYVCYDRAKAQNHSNFNVNQPSPDWSFDSAWSKHADRKLTSDEKKLVSECLSSRELQEQDVVSYNFSGKADDVNREKQRLGIPSERKCITIYTNLIWDAANVSRDWAFESALECVTRTIEQFRHRSDVQVILRSHPAEKVFGTKERYAELVRQHFGDDLPENATLLSPEDDVNSFTMIDITDVGVVNTSTVGLEMAVLGKPVVLISETHYRNRGFTIDVDNAEAYFDAIEKSLKEPVITGERQALAEKYFYMMMFLYQHPMPIRYTNIDFEGYTTDGFERLSTDEPLVKIVDSLTKTLPDDFVFWPQSSS